MEQIEEKCVQFFKWIWNECKDWKTIVIFAIVVLIVYLPTWGGFLLFLIFKWKWCAYIATFSLVFWAGPFTPFFPLCIAITLIIKRIIYNKKKEEN